MLIRTSYIYFLSLLIKKMDAIYDALVDKEVQLTEKGRKVSLCFLFHG